MVEKAMYKRYEDKKPCGTCHISNVFGIVLFEPDETDKYKENCDFIIAWSNGENLWGFHKHKVHYTTTGKAYIRKGSLKFYLNEIMKCNY